MELDLGTTAEPDLKDRPLSAGHANLDIPGSACPFELSPYQLGMISGELIETIDEESKPVATTGLLRRYNSVECLIYLVLI